MLSATDVLIKSEILLDSASEYDLAGPEAFMFVPAAGSESNVE